MSEIIDKAGEQRKLGCILDNRLTAVWPVFGEGATKGLLLPRSQWKPTTKRVLWAPKKKRNQLDQGKCNFEAICYGIEGIRRQTGMPEVWLNSSWGYGHINNGVDQGSSLEAGMAFAMKQGTCSTNFFPDGDWRTRPNGAEKDALRYRVLEAWYCPTFDHMASAVQAGFPVVIGIVWGNSDGVDSNNWMDNNPAGGSAGGHALCRLQLQNDGQRWGLDGPNSWGNWERDGYCIIPESRFSGFTGHWAIRSVVVNDDELGIPPLQTVGVEEIPELN